MTPRGHKAISFNDLQTIKADHLDIPVYDQFLKRPIHYE